MSNFAKFALLGVGGIVMLVLIVIGQYISINNQEIASRARFNSQQKMVEISHDKMWKVLAQKTGITKQFTPEDQIAMISEVVEGRTGGSFAKAVTEVNPTYDLSLLKDLSQSVEAEHAVVLNEEKKLLEDAATYQRIVENPYNKFFLGTKPILVAKVISSTRSKGAIESGIDDNVDLFSQPPSR
jgi:stringent starvation protein B